MKASQWLKKESLNAINQQWNQDGTVDILIFKYGWKKPYHCKMRNFGKKDEEILEDDEVTEKKEG